MFVEFLFVLHISRSVLVSTLSSSFHQPTVVDRPAHCSIDYIMTVPFLTLERSLPTGRPSGASDTMVLSKDSHHLRGITDFVLACTIGASKPKSATSDSCNSQWRRINSL